MISHGIFFVLHHILIYIRIYIYVYLFYIYINIYTLYVYIQVSYLCASHFKPVSRMVSRMHACNIYIYVYIYNTFFFSTGAREKQEHVEPSRHRIQMHSQASIRLALAQTCFIVETAGLSIYRHETWYLYMQALYIYTLAHLNSAGLSYIYIYIWLYITL